MKIVEAIISFALVVLTLCFVSMSTGPSDSLEIRTFNPFAGVARSEERLVGKEG